VSIKHTPSEVAASLLWRLGSDWGLGVLPKGHNLLVTSLTFIDLYTS